MWSRFGMICAMALLALTVTPAWAAKAPRAGADAEVRDWLRARLGPPPKNALSKPTAYSLAWADLNGDGRPEAIVYVSGGGLCGSGGCNMYILQSTAEGFRLRARTTVTRPPIALLAARTRGWRDVGVWVSGGGVLPGHQARLQFDGSTYPSNPSATPAVKGDRPAQVIITSDEDSSLLFDETGAKHMPPRG